ncbi:CoA transferase [Streptomyces sp. G2]|uniref:CoA transferase n=1 Tax=Streptomyces sp. G2 TaxID=1684471 RepID=UPI00202F5627|nr:CoA transferase [Streptomyces sp. G2]MCM1950986.1 CoA transferase [Streptomyces sp. G2]
MSLPEEAGTRAPSAPAGTARSVARELLGRTLDGLPGDAADQPSWTVGGAGPVGVDAGDERAAQAACGVMHVHGRAGGGPAPLTADYVSTVTGVLAAQGVTAALFARAQGRPPVRTGTSLAQGALLTVTQYLAAATAPDDDPAPPAAGLATLVTADGARVEIETLDPTAWAGFWSRLAVPPRTAGRGWLPFQSRFGTAVCLLPPELHAAVLDHPLEAVRAAGAAHGVSVVAVGEATTAPPGLAPWTVAPAPLAPSARVTAPAPAGDASRPLAGVRVVESARRVQGPMAGHVLRMLGAEVVRVEPPGGDPQRAQPPVAGGCSVRFSALNHGKSVVEADLTTRRGRAAVVELAAGADVFLHNWAPGKDRALGLDADALHALHPRLVYASASGFGTALGPVPPIGTDYLAQVHGGLAAALRPADEPPAPSLMTVTDVLGGLVLAQAVLAGLLARERVNRGCRASSSLLSAAALVPRARRRTVLAPLDRPLPTADGLLCLGAEARSRPGEVARTVGAPGADAVGERLRSRTTDAWLAELRAAGLPSVAVRTDLAALAADPAFARAVLPPDAHVPYARPAAPWTFTEETPA